MPFAKKKSKAETDSSDSGPDDREPVAKKSKQEKKKSGGDDEEPTWMLDKRRMLKIREFKGRLMVDIREYYDADGDLRPGKKGISLSIPQWKKIVESMSEIEDAIKEKA